MRSHVRSLLAALLVGSIAPRALAEAAPLTLQQALEQARKNSPILRKAGAQTDAAEARAGSSRGRLLPQLVASGSYQYTTANFVPRPGFTPNNREPVVTDPDTGRVLTVTAAAPITRDKYDFVHSYNFQIVANQLIYDFGASTEAFKADKRLGRAQAELQRSAVLSTELAVRNAFFLARANRALIRVAEETLQNQQKHLEQAQAFVEVGTRPEIDLAQARTDMANARVRLISAQNGYATAKQNLSIVLGADGADFEVSDDTLEPLPEENTAVADSVAQARATRPEVAALARQLEAQGMRTRAAKGRFGPALNATAATSKAGVELGNLTWNAYVGATVSWPLLESGTTYYALRESQANQRGLEADLRAMLLRIRGEVEQAHLTVQAAKATVEAADEALANARARLGLAEGRYEAGVGNAIELGDAQLALTTADAQRVQSEYNLAIARAQLLSALGKAQ